VSGHLYAVWEDRRFDSQAGNIAFSMSADGGFTWSTPVRVNRTPDHTWPPNRQAFTPSVSVASDGTIGVTYYDFRNNQAFQPGATTDYWLVHCRPVTATACTDTAGWRDEVRLTDTSFDLEKAPVARGLFLGDYQGLATDGDDFLALFSQTHGSDPASVFFRRVRP
jgi:hypothetical protein